MKKTLPPAVLAIIHAVAEEYGVTVGQILSDSRRRNVARARHAAITEARAKIKIAGEAPSLPRLGLWFGRHHTSVYRMTKCETQRQRELAAKQKDRAASLERRLAWSRDVPRVPLATKGRAAA